MNNLETRKAQLREYIEASKKIAEGPYSVERVDFEDDEITYEVSTPGKGFHVVFRESDSLDEGISSKHQSEFYALTANESARIAEELLECIEALEQYSNKYNYSLIDEGRNYMSNYVCYECDPENMIDKELGTKARETLSKIAGEK